MNNPESKELRCLDILQGIKKGTVDPASLISNQRKLLVTLLMAEGQSTAEIAHILKVSDRTIERDKNAIRQENALSQDPKLADIMAGRLSDEAQLCIQRIRKFQRDTNCPPAAKIDGERACFQIINSLTERLQSMGYLPTAAKKLEADLTHHSEETMSLDEITSEAQHLKDIDNSLPEKGVKQVRSEIIKGRARSGLKR